MKVAAAILLLVLGASIYSQSFTPWILDKSSSYRDAYWTGYRDALRAVAEAREIYGVQATLQAASALAARSTPLSLSISGELFFWRVGAERFYLAPLDGAIAQLRGGF